jgi:hypothetical protein
VEPTVEIKKGFYKAQTIAGTLDAYVGNKRWLPSDKKTANRGRNLIYWGEPNHKTVVMEYEPRKRKEILNLNDLHQDVAPQNASFVPIQRNVPPPTFGTIDELYYAQQNVVPGPISGDRGGACCATIVDNQGRKLLLGVSHNKIVHHRFTADFLSQKGIPKNTYFSSFYAMQPSSPYNVVARTGRFCLGFPSHEEMQASGHPYRQLAAFPAVIGGITYKCPRIHYVTGIVDKVDDPSKLIVSYGINDCFSRFVVVEKADVVRMLFPDTMAHRA